jgi:hypothetical protein
VTHDTVVKLANCLAEQITAIIEELVTGTKGLDVQKEK